MKRGSNAFLVNFNTHNFQGWIHAAKARGGIKRGARIKA